MRARLSRRRLEAYDVYRFLIFLSVFVLVKRIAYSYMLQAAFPLYLSVTIPTRVVVWEIPLGTFSFIVWGSVAEGSARRRAWGSSLFEAYIWYLLIGLVWMYDPGRERHGRWMRIGWQAEPVMYLPCGRDDT